MTSYGAREKGDRKCLIPIHNDRENVIEIGQCRNREIKNAVRKKSSNKVKEKYQHTLSYF